MKPGFRIALPELNRDKHSLFASNASAAGKWLHSLPRANLGETTRQLYLALAELNHVRCKGKERLEMLEALRGDVHAAIGGLAQHYLSKPLVLSEKVEKIVLLADTLNNQLAVAYCQAYLSLVDESRLLRPTDALATSLQRALTEYACILLRSYQLHRSPPGDFWLKLHSIYRVAQAAKLRRHKVSDKIHGDGTVTQAYLRPLLLACSRPHQLPQRFLAGVFTELLQWTGVMELRSERLESCVFLINPDEDKPPSYRELVKQAPSNSWLGIDTRPLLEQGTRLVAGDQLLLPNNILDQLLIAWSASTDRAAERIPCDEPALLALGLASSHYFVAGELDFDDFKIDSDELGEHADPFAERSESSIDPWRGAGLEAVDQRPAGERPALKIDYDYDPGRMETINYSLPQATVKQRSGERHQHVKSRILDISDNGYRIEWPAEAAMRIRNGEVVAVRPQSSEAWNLAVIRWMRSDERHQIGVQILASVASPYSVRIVHSGLAHGDYQRAMLLPVGDRSSKPTLLLAAVASFTPGQTVELQRPGHAMRVKLLEQLEDGGAYKIFEFEQAKRSKREAPVADRDKPDVDGQFNKLWDVL